MKPQFTADGVLLSEVGGVEEMISRFLEGGQHEDALLHFGQTEPGDSQYLPLYGEKTACTHTDTHTHTQVKCFQLHKTLWRRESRFLPVIPCRTWDLPEAWRDAGQCSFRGSPWCTESHWWWWIWQPRYPKSSQPGKTHRKASEIQAPAWCRVPAVNKLITRQLESVQVIFCSIVEIQDWLGMHFELYPISTTNEHKPPDETRKCRSLWGFLFPFVSTATDTKRVSWTNLPIRQLEYKVVKQFKSVLATLKQPGKYLLSTALDLLWNHCFYIGSSIWQIVFPHHLIAKML